MTLIELFIWVNQLIIFWNRISNRFLSIFIEAIANQIFLIPYRR